jgi:hypothetical protein
VLFFQEHNVIRDRAVVAVVHNELIRGHVSLGIVGCNAQQIERVVGYDGRPDVFYSETFVDLISLVLVFVFVVFVFERVVDVHAEDVIAVIVQFPYKVF